MAIYQLGDKKPKIHSTAYVHEQATVIGDVEIGEGSSVWPGAVLRGDFAKITIGKNTSVQDGSVIHVAHGYDTTIGDDCVVGHLVHIEGAKVNAKCLIGVGSVLLHDVEVGEGTLVGANALVKEGTKIPASHMALGVPAKIINKQYDAFEISRIAKLYVSNSQNYKKNLKRID